MWQFIARKLLYNIPVYLGALLVVFIALRVQDPVYAYLGQDAGQAQYDALKEEMGLNRPQPVQFAEYVWNVATLNFDQDSWAQKGTTVGDILKRSVMPTLSITVPQVVLSTLIGVVVALISAYFRGRLADRALVFIAVLGMSISFLVYIIFGQYFLAGLPQEGRWDVAPFA
ncbi:MAG: ABC transporter permease, partial [Planctomycetota bacterium]